MAIEPRRPKLVVTPLEAARRKIMQTQATLDERQRREEDVRLGQWAAAYDRERQALIGPRALSAMRDLRARHDREPSTGADRGRRRFEHVQLARDSRVDLEALSRLDQARSAELKSLIGAGRFDASARLDWIEPDQASPPKPPVLFKEDFPVSDQVFQPPYAWWDRSWFSFGWDNTSILANDSHLNGDAGVVGATLWGRTKNAGNLSVQSIGRENGVLVPFTPGKAGVVEFTVRLQCATDQQRIWTYNEPGWSNASIFITEAVRLAAFWNFEDTEPMFQASGGDLTPLYYYLGNGDGYPGTWTKAAAGAEAEVSLYTGQAFQPGVPIWFYVGLSNRIYAALDDVSANLWSVSSWLIKAIRVQTY